MSFTSDTAKEGFEKAIEHFHEEAKKLRTGRAQSSMLDGIEVEVYGQKTPLQHVATITVVDAQMLQIQPFDPSNLEKISAAIRDQQSLGLNPADDGRVVRVPIPPMTTERRQQVVKQLHEKVEETNISFRNIRHDVLNDAKKQKNDGDISEDDMKQIEKQVTEQLQDYKAQLEAAAKEKEEEILTV